MSHFYSPLAYTLRVVHSFQRYFLFHLIWVLSPYWRCLGGLLIPENSGGTPVMLQCAKACPTAQTYMVSCWCRTWTEWLNDCLAYENIKTQIYSGVGCSANFQKTSCSVLMSWLMFSLNSYWEEASQHWRSSSDCPHLSYNSLLSKDSHAVRNFLISNKYFPYFHFQLYVPLL